LKGGGLDGRSGCVVLQWMVGVAMGIAWPGRGRWRWGEGGAAVRERRIRLRVRVND